MWIQGAPGVISRLHNPLICNLLEIIATVQRVKVTWLKVKTKFNIFFTKKPRIVHNEHFDLSFQTTFNIDGLVQERCNSNALTTELHLSCINPSICQWLKARCSNSSVLQGSYQYRAKPLMCSEIYGVFNLDVQIHDKFLILDQSEVWSITGFF